MLTQEAIFIATIKGTSLVIKTRPLLLPQNSLAAAVRILNKDPKHLRILIRILIAAAGRRRN